MFQRCSPETVYHRFQRVITEVPHDLGSRLCNIDYDREIAIVVELTEKGTKQLVGEVRVLINPNERSGEFRLLVADPWQNQGLGTKLTDHVITICEEKGLTVLTGVIFQENVGAITLLERMGFTITRDEDGSRVHATLDLTDA
jgi:acetyltransferase